MIPYYTEHIKDQPVYRCLRCPFDSFDATNIVQHCNLSHPTLKLPEMDMDLVPWFHDKVISNPLKDKKIAFCLLTWNTCAASEFASSSISAEQFRLQLLGINSSVFWVDNASSDGTQDAVNQRLSREVGLAYRAPFNMGNCITRNLMIDAAMEWGADYLYLIDGDIETIPYSAFAMSQFLHFFGGKHRVFDDKSVGCIGLLSNNCTSEWDEQTARSCRRIELTMINSKPNIAWTQYGVFSREVFESGVRFDENPPFNSPGWGFEDLDLYLTMKSKGFECLNTPYFRHIHRHRHSSIPLLGSLAAKAFEARKTYVLEKWCMDKELHTLLEVFKTYRMPVL